MGESLKNARKDREEVRKYLVRHPGASSTDVAMVCNMTSKQARAIMDTITWR
jgi:hypothetical protein